MKYAEEGDAVEISSAPGYRDINRQAVLEMFRQSGHLQNDANGIALKGLIIRHLVLPGGKAGSRETLRWIAENIGKETHIALMSQYFPAGEATRTAGIHRPLTEEEYDEATAALEENGLENGWVQELEEERGAV
jgi:putative pyruvate formate lyase activating enzyme